MFLLSKRVKVNTTSLTSLFPSLTITTNTITPITTQKAIAIMPKRRAASTTTAPTYKKAKPTATTDTTAGPATDMRVQRVDDNGNPFWEIGANLRRVAVSEFKGKQLVSIREHFEKDGRIFPAKKGISLSIEQLNNLIAVLPQIENYLEGQGVIVERPDYDAAIPPPAAEEVEEEAEAEETEEEEEEPASSDYESSEEEEVAPKKGRERGER